MSAEEENVEGAAPEENPEGAAAENAEGAAEEGGAGPEEGAEGAEGAAEGDEEKKEGEPGAENGEGDGGGEGEGGEEGADGEKLGIKERIEKDPHELNFLVPLPEVIEFYKIPKINDARSVWRLGMRKLEETFAEHIANMHLDFEDKAN